MFKKSHFRIPMGIKNICRYCYSILLVLFDSNLKIEVDEAETDTQNWKKFRDLNRQNISSENIRISTCVSSLCRMSMHRYVKLKSLKLIMSSPQCSVCVCVCVFVWVCVCVNKTITKSSKSLHNAKCKALIYNKSSYR